MVPPHRLLASTLLVSASLAGCAADPLPDSAIMPRTAAGVPLLTDEQAIQLASYALGAASRTAGQPGPAARALASVDFLAGDLYANFHWTGMPSTTKLRMLGGRAELRQVLAVAPGTSSQVVVDDLMQAAAAFDRRDDRGALGALPAAVFTLGPQRTAALLADLPYLPAANIAVQAANRDITFGCGITGACV